jgi:hypothetical protein
MVEGGGPATPYVHLWVRERRHACGRAGEGEADGSRSKLKPIIFWVQQITRCPSDLNPMVKIHIWQTHHFYKYR